MSFPNNVKPLGKIPIRDAFQVRFLLGLWIAVSIPNLMDVVNLLNSKRMFHRKTKIINVE
jgi:hypothetical protein